MWASFAKPTSAMAKDRTRTVTIILAGLALLAVLAAAWLAVDVIRRWQASRAAEAEVQEIVSLLNLEAIPDFHRRLDTVRSFINDHSMHKIDQAFWTNHGSAAAFAAGVIAHAKDPSIAPIHMECSTRTNLMGLILDKLGYQTRVVAIFDSDTNLNSHSFLETMNPDTGRWETQDADYDIYWRRKDSGERVSLADAAEQIDDIEPCGRDHCGWNHESREGIRAERIQPYLDIIGITDKKRDIRYALYTSRADLGRLYTKNNNSGRFCQVEAKRCKQGFIDQSTNITNAAGLPR
jgi:hypothetical protein